MRFAQIDRIIDLQSEKSITAIRSLSLSEDYLKDHFPRFPVMPGVLMIESLFQASMWLVRVSERFRHSVVALRGTRGVRFSGFVQPGDQLIVTATVHSREGSLWQLKAAGKVNGGDVVSGRIFIDTYNLSDRGLGSSATDDFMRREFRLTFRRLCNQLVNNDWAQLACDPK
jgi:3-hydroxyacyl-[acyl-carrier-protein] dehydratase